jgi:S-adenosylmethionine/arginine decarboxylase-like enzyme
MEGTAMADRQRDRPYGWSARIDLHECDQVRLRSRETIEEFVRSLCDEVLHIRRHGELLIEWFGSPDDQTGGYSFVQLIETSSVVGHASESLGSLYLDVFSCRSFDVESAARHATEHFSAETLVTTSDIRR